MPADRFYTPPLIAKRMVEQISDGPKEPVVADFAVGAGSLLFAASARWPSANILGVDLDNRALKKLATQHINWELIKCDFLGKLDRFQPRILQERGFADVILLNPPFSNRGNKKWKTDIFGRSIECSLALAFLLRSLRFLGPQGQLAALLPSGSLRSERDAAAWEVVRKEYEVDLINSFGDREFLGCNAQTTLIKISKANRRKSAPEKICPPKTVRAPGGNTVTIRRGTIDVTRLHPVTEHTIPLVHTTHLQKGKVSLNGIRVSKALATLRGPAILLPRVCRFNPEKIALLSGGDQVAVSSCVISIQVLDRGKTKLLFELLRENPALVQDCYTGTCAKYTTLNIVGQLLESLGYVVAC